MAPGTNILLLVSLALLNPPIIDLATTSIVAVADRRKRKRDKVYGGPGVGLSFAATAAIGVYVDRPSQPPAKKKKYYHRKRKDCYKTADDVMANMEDEHFRGYFRFTKLEFVVLCRALDIPKEFVVHGG